MPNADNVNRIEMHRKPDVFYKLLKMPSMPKTNSY